MKLSLVTLGTVALVLSGCAHGKMRGSVAMKTSERDAHVCLDKGDAKVGDTVQLFSNRCTKGPKGDGPSCEKVAQGNGIVSGIINDHYSVVTFDQGVKFAEGDFVEKL